MITPILYLLLLLPSTLSQTLSLPLVNSPLFNTLSGETIVTQTLNSWNIKLGPISLGFSGSGINLGLGTRDEETTSRVEQPEVVTPRRKRGELKSRLGLNLGLGINLGGTSVTVTANTTGLITGLLGSLGLLGTSRSPGVDKLVAKGTPGDVEWYITLSFGTPPQSLPLLPDTATSDLFLFSTLCPSCPPDHARFSPTDSTTYTSPSPQKTWSLTYGDDSNVQGFSAADSVTLNTGTLLNLELALATSVQGSTLTDLPPSGVIGLGLDPLCTLPLPSPAPAAGRTLFSRLVRANVLAKPVLGIRLVKSVSSQGNYIGPAVGGAGAFVFGETEDTYIVGGYAGLKWTPVISSFYWGLNLTDVLVGSTSAMQYTKQTNSRTIIDTGTTLIITSSELAYYLHYFIPGSRQSATSGIWLIPCNISYLTPGAQNVFFEIGGNRWGVPLEDLAWRTSVEGGGMCISGIQGGMSAFTVLGDMFIKNHYVVLSYGSSTGNKLQVGIGNRTDVPLIL